MANHKKKRKKKKVYYKPIYKGVRYITNTLLKKYPKRYKSRKEASDEANRLLSILNSEGKKVTKGNAINILVSERKSRRVYKTTELPKSMTDALPYYEVEYLLKDIFMLPSEPKITFTSELIPEGLPEIVSGKEYSYSDYFKAYVNYMDSLRSQSEVDYYEQEWFVRCTKAKKTKIHADTFYSRIIACDAFGNEISDSYGFDRTDIDLMPSTGFVLEEGKEYLDDDDSEISKPSSSSSDIDKQIRLKELENESDRLKNEGDKLKIEKAKELRALLDAKVPYEDAKKLLGLD
jgi:hypothetical protein